MTDQKPSEPTPSDEEAAVRSQDAGIADESAAYENASDATAKDESEAHPS